MEKSGRPKKRNIVFDAFTDFHFFHVEPIVKMLVNDDRFNVIVVMSDNFTLENAIENVKYITSHDFKENWSGVYDILITTEFDRKPRWFGDSIAICMFHGVGPKMGYIRNPKINDYDVIFSAGPATYDVQTGYVANDTKVIPVGLPVTDSLIDDSEVKLPASIKLDNSKPTLLYAPSWASDSNDISMDEGILKELKNIKDYNIIVRPHPFLLEASKCGGKDWTILFDELAQEGISISYSNDHSVYQILKYVDVLLGDVSSVVYEYLILNRPIMLYMDDNVLTNLGAADFLEPLLSASTRVMQPADLVTKLSDIKVGDESKSQARQALLKNTLFNVGSSTKIAGSEIIKLTYPQS